MNLLEQTLTKIKPLNKAAVHNIEQHLSSIMSNATGLGCLKDILLTYAGITSEHSPSLPKKCTVIACGDHGVAAMKVSAYPPETTVHMTRNYLESKGATANAMANFSASHMIVVDMGIGAPTGDIPGLLDRKVALGTKNCAQGPAMTRQEALQSLHTGIELVEEYIAKGYRCFLPGEMGIANTTASASIVACLCDLTPEAATGRGTNISDERLKLKIDVVRQALTVNQPDPSDGLDVLQKVGGFELGCITGMILGAAANRAFVVLDGFNTGAAALIAHALCPTVRSYLMGSHLAAEPAHKAILAKLDIQPYMDMRFRLGEATGSSIVINLLDAAVRAYDCLTIDAIPTLSRLEISANVQTVPAVRPAPVPPLDQEAMEACQLRIDNLCKPIYSLGRLEKIAVKLAGITGCKQPQQLQKELLCLCYDEGLSSSQQKLTAAFAEHAGAKARIVPQPLFPDLNAAFCFGEALAAEAAKNGSVIVGIGTSEICPADICGTKAARQRQLLYTKEQQRCYSASEFLQQPASRELSEIAVLVGFMTAAPQHHLLVVLDAASTEFAASYAVELSPEAAPYILHTQPNALNLGMTTGGGCVAALGMKLIDASLHMLNDMKTFAEASVAVANDGPGAGRQTTK